MQSRAGLSHLSQIPNVGPATIRYLEMLGIHKPSDLIGRDPYSMFEELCALAGRRVDPCLADVFIAAVRFMEGGAPRKWWDFTHERKRHYRKHRGEG